MWTVLYVIAGDKKEFNDFVLRNVETNRYRETNFVMVGSAEAFIGVQNPDGICIGTWKERPDMNEILSRLLIACKDPSKFQRVRELELSLQAYQHQNLTRIQALQKTVIFGSPNGA